MTQELILEIVKLSGVERNPKKSILHWLDTEVLPVLVGPTGQRVFWTMSGDGLMSLWTVDLEMPWTSPSSERLIEPGQRLAMLILKSGCERKNAGPYMAGDQRQLFGPGLERWFSRNDEDAKNSVKLLNIAYAKGIEAGKK